MPKLINTNSTDVRSSGVPSRFYMEFTLYMGRNVIIMSVRINIGSFTGLRG